MIARRTAVSLALTLALAIGVGVGRAEDKKAPPNPEDLAKALAEAAKPGPEHARLKALEGSWTYTCKCWMDPNKPAESKGTIERKWVLGGRFLEERVNGTNFDGTPGFEGFGLLGYDNGTKKYSMTWTCTMSTSVSNGIGTFESPGKFTFKAECYCPVMKQNIKSRDEIRIESDDKVVMESYMLMDGKEVKMMEIVANRKK